jgi:hypothetical protein
LVISAPPLSLGLAPYGGEGLCLGRVPFANQAPAARADAASFFDDGETAERVGLHVEPMEVAHVARWIDAVKMHGVHAASLDMVFWLTLELHAVFALPQIEIRSTSSRLISSCRRS